MGATSRQGTNARQKSTSSPLLPDSASGLPLYQQLADNLRAEIMNGVYPVGSLLPTEDTLGQKYAVSRHTVREALRQLREDGLISSKRGAGSLVLLPQASQGDIHQVMSIKDLLAFSDDTQFEIDAIKLVTVNRVTSEQLGVEQNSDWLKVSGFRYRKGSKIPLCWTEYYINREYAAVGRLLQRYKGPIFTLIEDFSGLNIVEVEQQASATLISQALSAGLQAEPDSAALVIRRTYKATENKILQITINTHPADRFQHTMTMRRIRQP